jgi:hypothetical protein
MPIEARSIKTAQYKKNLRNKGGQQTKEYKNIMTQGDTKPPTPAQGVQEETF